ncbi:hypothetical protein L6164_013488 [Bauhinia variegata]|uniref:Uncharacterized protein n=1 Tax=Bauhinia variegata TaxID=167791 RepID=A0ACB9NEH0_BAUVA|nr:hypothetical protein L6164_013488 [Bauhinia variegata]
MFLNLEALLKGDKSERLFAVYHSESWDSQFLRINPEFQTQKPKDRVLAVSWRSLLLFTFGSLLAFNMAYEISEIKKIGIGLIGFGTFFTFLSIILFFDRGLLALGNIFWLTGVALLLGWGSMWNLFTNRANYKGSASFLLGLFFIFVRWPVVGIILEIYGCIVLFSGFSSSVQVFLYQIPIIGWILQYPFLLLDRLRRG